VAGAEGCQTTVSRTEVQAVAVVVRLLPQELERQGKETQVALGLIELAAAAAVLAQQVKMGLQI
jgi:hypothetical protein